MVEREAARDCHARFGGDAWMAVLFLLVDADGQQRQRANQSWRRWRDALRAGPLILGAGVGGVGKR